MKSIKIIISVILFSWLGISCDHDELLTEVPKDFLTPENSYTTVEGFEAAVAHLMSSIRDRIYVGPDHWGNYIMFGSDVDLARTGQGVNDYWQSIQWQNLNADNGFVYQWWDHCYTWIFHANTVINRAESDVVTWASDAEKNAIVGSAKFIRAFAYRFLANMWGGAPLVLEETSGPTFDYTRASKSELYQQCITDLEFAIQWMKTVDQVKGGMAPRAAAYHLLAEIKIASGDYQGAINAASAVINDPNYELKTERFGVYKDFKWQGYDYQGPNDEPWGDVYWDLFREGNFNWKAGNHECIWNIQQDPDIVGGYGTGYNQFALERHWHAWWAPVDKAGYRTDFKDTLMGQPVGIIHPTQYAAEDMWNYKGDWDKDIRNSKYNIQRTFYYTNRKSPYYGQVVTEDNINNPSNFFCRSTPSWKKGVPVLHHGTRGLRDGMKNDGGAIFKDWYIMRLAETYLLRAEAYHLDGQNGKAADDINTVRTRSQATPVTAGEVDLDLILDERARELYQEEYRVNTLLRMGKFVEYVRKYNGAVNHFGYNIGDHLNLLPIPNSEIEANKEAVLEQNPGY